MFKNMLKIYRGTFDQRHKFIGKLPQGSKVADLGSGEGVWIKKLMEFRPDIFFEAVDIKDHSGQMPGSVKFHRCDFLKENLPFRDGSFDAIMIMHVIEHLIDPNLILRECRRVLKPGGQIYIETPSLRSLFVPSFNVKKYNEKNDMQGPYNFYDDPTHIRPYSRFALCQLFRNNGFHVEEIGYARNLMLFFLTPFYVIFGLLMRKRILMTYAVSNFVGWTIYGIARNKK
jgi:SAM-dependent methyltransferase